MKKKLTMFVTSILIMIFLFACNRTTKIDIEAQRQSYLEVIPDATVTFDNFMDTIIFFEDEESAYRVELDLTEATFIINQVAGHDFKFAFSSEESAFRRIRIAFEDSTTYEKHIPYFQDNYNEYLILPGVNSILMAYPLPNNNGYISMYGDYPYDYKFSMEYYKEISKPFIEEWLDAITITEIDKNTVKQAPIYTDTVDGLTWKTFSYPNGSIFKLDEEFFLDLSQIDIAYKTSYSDTDSKHIKFFYSFNNSLIGSIFYIPSDIYGDTSTLWSNTAPTFNELLKNHTKEMITLKGIDFIICQHPDDDIEELFRYYIIYKGNDFSLLIRPFPDDNDVKNFTLEDRLALLERLIIEQ